MPTYILHFNATTLKRSKKPKLGVKSKVNRCNELLFIASSMYRHTPTKCCHAEQTIRQKNCAILFSRHCMVALLLFFSATNDEHVHETRDSDDETRDRSLPF